MKKRARELLRSCGILRTWKGATWRLINSVKEWNEKIDFLSRYGRISASKSAESTEWDVPFTYRIDKEYKKYFIHLFFSDKNGKLNVWKINSIQPSKCGGQGRKANTIEKELFLKYNGVTERVAFGYCDREVIYKCVPKQLYYIDESSKNKNIEHVSKADISSHYPSNLCGIMPTWKDHLTVDGTVKPSAEYPFAYYIKSGHFAEFNGVDTHKWLNTPLWFWLFGDNYSPEVAETDDVTILCKASKYKFDDVVAELYAKKNNGESINGVDVKIILNASIGYKHLSNLNAKQNRLDHLAVVCLARSNDKMIKYFRRGETLQIIVDSIIYRGTHEVGGHEKKLGEFKQEITDATFRMRGINQYAFDKNGDILMYSHSGFDSNTEIKKLEDIDKWSKNDIIKIRE